MRIIASIVLLAMGIAGFVANVAWIVCVVPILIGIAIIFLICGAIKDKIDGF